MSVQATFDLPGASPSGAWRALTLTQPWATLVAGGEKRVETRSWYTSYRGPLAIHAGLAMPRICHAMVEIDPFRVALERCRQRGLFTTALPRGAVVATCELAGCQYIDPKGRQFDVDALSYEERAFGNFTPGRYAWLLVNVRPLPSPILAKGALGLWTWHRR